MRADTRPLSLIVAVAVAVAVAFASAGAVPVLGAGSTQQREPDLLYCGRVIALSCGSGEQSDATLVLEVSGGEPRVISIAESARDDVAARIGQPLSGRTVCVARTAAPGVIAGGIRVQLADEVIVRDGVAGAARSDVHSTCDRAVQPPRVMREHKPQYTPDAMRARASGTVVLHAIVDAKGRVTHVQVVSGIHESLDAEARNALARWEFLPATRLGEPVAVSVVAELTFTLRPPGPP